MGRAFDGAQPGSLLRPTTASYFLRLAFGWKCYWPLSHPPLSPSRPGDLIGREGPKRAPNDPNTNPLYTSTKHKRMRSASQQRYSGFAKMARRAAARVKHPKCGFIMGSFSKTINDRPSDKLANTHALIIGRPLSHSLSRFTPPVEGFGSRGKVRGLHGDKINYSPKQYKHTLQ